MGAASPTRPGFLADLYETSGPLLRHLARALVDSPVGGSPAAATVFDELTAGAVEFLSRTWPERLPPGRPGSMTRRR